MAARTWASWTCVFASLEWTWAAAGCPPPALGGRRATAHQHRCCHPDPEQDLPAAPVPLRDSCFCGHLRTPVRRRDQLIGEAPHYLDAARMTVGSVARTPTPRGVGAPQPSAGRPAAPVVPTLVACPARPSARRRRRPAPRRGAGGWATDAGSTGRGPPPWAGRGPWGGGRPPQVGARGGAGRHPAARDPRRRPRPARTPVPRPARGRAAAHRPGRARPDDPRPGRRS